MQCYVFHGAKGVDYWQDACDDGHRYIDRCRLRGGQILWRKSEPYIIGIPLQEFAWFSARDLHNDVGGQTYPDFTFERISETPERYIDEHGNIIYPLFDFNASVWGMKPGTGSYYNITEGVQYYDHSSGVQLTELHPGEGDKVWINYEHGYAHMKDGDIHGGIATTGYYNGNTGTWIYHPGYIDHDPTQWPSQHGLNTW